MQEKWIQNLSIEDMPNELFQDIAAICGLETAISLLTKMQGANIYVPTQGFKKLRNSYIQKKFDGSTTSIRKLAIELKVSEQCIRDVLKENDNNIQPNQEVENPRYKQRKLFE